MPGIIDALNRRDVEALLDLSDTDVAVEIRAAGRTSSNSNDHLWRLVRLRGRTALRAYLTELFALLPSIHVRADEVRGLPCWATVVAEFTGVDSAGLPFAAVTYIRLRGDGRRIRTLTVEVLDLEVGPDLLSRGDRDPRQYFEAFLGQMQSPGAA